MTNPELYTNIALLRALVATNDFEKVKEVLDDVYLKLGGKIPEEE